MRGHGSQWFSHKIINQHQLQLKKSKSLEPFGSYQLNSTATPAHLPQNRPNYEVNGLDWQCCLAVSSKTAPRIVIFSINLGAEYLSYMRSIVTCALTFFDLSIALTKTKYIKLNTKTQHIFCCVNENLTIFLYTLTVHIEDFTRARVNEIDLTAVLVETGEMPVPTKSRNPTACA
jgi:hypothetical protein